jgi:hypothetical protein
MLKIVSIIAIAKIRFTDLFPIIIRNYSNEELNLAAYYHSTNDKSILSTLIAPAAKKQKKHSILP